MRTVDDEALDRLGGNRAKQPLQCSALRCSAAAVAVQWQWQWRCSGTAAAAAAACSAVAVQRSAVAVAAEWQWQRQRQWQWAAADRSINCGCTLRHCDRRSIATVWKMLSKGAAAKLTPAWQAKAKGECAEYYSKE